MVIGLMGFKQSGKSTAAKYLEERYGFVRINFKTALVEEIKAKFPDLLKVLACFYFPDTGVDNVTPEMIDWLFEEKPAPMRALMQNYGTEVRRGDNPDYWVNQWIASTMINKGKWIVADDVRFFNEAKAVKDNGGMLLRITRPDIQSGGGHTSETEAMHIQEDRQIEALPGGHDALYKQLDEYVAYLTSQVPR